MLTRRIWCQGKVDVGNKRLKIQEREEVAHGAKSLKWGTESLLLQKGSHGDRRRDSSSVVAGGNSGGEDGCRFQFVDLAWGGGGELGNSQVIVLLVKGEGDSLTVLKKSWRWG